MNLARQPAYSFLQMKMAYFGGGFVACAGVCIERGFYLAAIVLVLLGIGLHLGALFHPAAPSDIGR